MNTAPAARARRFPVWARLVLVCAAVPLLFEGALRFLLFSDTAASWPTAPVLRQAWRFGNTSNDQLYWVLTSHWSVAEAKRRARGDAARLAEIAQRDPPPGYDPVVGWVGWSIRPGTLAHPDAAQVRGRRPILLYGDSFAMCTTQPDDCFQGLLQRSPLAERFALVNYGVGGHGLDQIWLMLRGSVDRYREQRPLVIVSLLVDDDLDRSVLSFRSWPKPRVSLAGERLVLDPAPVPTREEYFKREGFPPAVYSWRLLAHDRRLPRKLASLLQREETQRERIGELNRRILAEIASELAARELDAFFLLFFAEPAFVDPHYASWREEIACNELERLGARVVSARRAILQDAEASGRSAGDYFEREGLAAGHYNAHGNRAVFAAIEGALAGEFDPPWVGAVLLPLELSGALEPAPPARKVLRGVHALARVEPARPGTAESAGGRALVLRAGTGGATEVHLALDGRARALRARVRVSGPAAGEASAAPPGAALGAQLSIELDGRSIAAPTLAADAPPAALDLDVRGARKLVLRVAGTSEASARLPSALVALEGIELELEHGR
jgi:hypothetical protein